MKEIYLKDENGNKITVQVSDDLAVEYRKSLREEWKNDAYENYHTVSLENAIETGKGFAAEQPNAEEIFIENCERQERQLLLKKLKVVLPKLTELQRSTIHKLFALNMSQAEIAREEGVSQQVVNRRVARIYAQLKRFLKNN